MLASVMLAAVVVLVADRDATIIENADGTLANGSGPVVLAGRNNLAADGIRRGLFRFDLGALEREDRVVPAVSAALVLANTTESNVDPREYRLHRLLADWTEGPAYASGGGGVPAAAGDVSWIHASYPSLTWLHAGAQFEGAPSVRLIVAGAGIYRFEGDGIDADVALWFRHPERNFGWILIGDETTRQTSRAFGSRENPDPALRPALELTYPRRAH